METTASARIHGRRSRLPRALLLGAAVGAIACASARSETVEARTPEPAQVAIPAQQIAPPPAGARDLSTGAIGSEATAPVPDNAIMPASPVAPPQDIAPPPGVVTLAPVPAALTALLADAGPNAALKIARDDRDALGAFYAARQGEPVWITDGRFTPKAEAAKARIAAAAGDALDPRDFKLPSPPATDAPAEIVRAEAQLSAAALAYARKAWGGRVSPLAVSKSITAEPSPFDAGLALASFEGSGDIAATLDGFNPQHPQFQELRKLLADARKANGSGEPDLPKIGYGKLLEPGGDDPRVPALRTRLGLTGGADDFYYDAETVDAVMAFQRKNKIGASGLLNKQTLRALNAVIRPHTAAELIEINMERWRWMPRDLGPKHVFVDIPVFHLHIMENGASTYETRVIVGKSANQTPVFSDAIDHIVVNPYWNVPTSIALKEMQNGSLRGFEVVDSRGKRAALSWEGIRTNRLRIRQPPGERNALGAIKFMFPNKHSVYLHDTSSRKLFANADRALSHGCVRVDKPLEFADALSGDQGFSGAKLKSMIGGKERSLTLTTPIPVHLTYFTAWVGDGGTLETRPDLYSLDGRLRAALRGEPLPPLLEEAAPKVMARAKPKPKPKPAAVATVARPPQPQQVAAPSNWLARIFGDSRTSR